MFNLKAFIILNFLEKLGENLFFFVLHSAHGCVFYRTHCILSYSFCLNSKIKKILSISPQVKKIEIYKNNLDISKVLVRSPVFWCLFEIIKYASLCTVENKKYFSSVFIQMPHNVSVCFSHMYQEKPFF